MDDSGKGRLPPSFRKLDVAARRAALRSAFPFPDDEWAGTAASPETLELLDVMVESTVGCVPLPLGIAQGFLIDDKEVLIPMAVEEPSVITAASFAARLVREDGGFRTRASDPLMTAQVFLESVTVPGERALMECEAELRRALAGPLTSLSRRGGGYRSFQVARLPSGTVRVDLVIDVRDALGANRLNTAAESVRPLLERVSGGRALMAILSNAAAQRLAGARFSIPVERLGRGLPAGMSGRGGCAKDCGGIRCRAGGPVARRHAQQGNHERHCKPCSCDSERHARGRSGRPSLGLPGRHLPRSQPLLH